MIRIIFEGVDLADFTSLSPDDHVKIFIPAATGGPERRDYTPRSFSAKQQTLAIDFAVHDAGPATKWAMSAKPGDQLEVGGPRGSTIVPESFDWWLLIGDETALPAIGRRLEEFSPNVKAQTVVAVTGREEEQRFETQSNHSALWVHRPLNKADDAEAWNAALDEITLPEGDGFIWIAAEASVARALRDYFLKRGQPLAWMKAAGYWRKGVADAHEKIES